MSRGRMGKVRMTFLLLLFSQTPLSLNYSGCHGARFGGSVTPDPTKPQLRAISAMRDELLNVAASVSVSEDGGHLILFILKVARRTRWDNAQEVPRAAHSAPIMEQ